ncbi:MAG TPA: pyridoxamine 5'-phosphate oxidase [Chloroflexota bacterium]|jgi:PPOX class probable F420-dependent enzyme|nr:pyridoxamine 5'-phosphate oxidase [Chloroflexota bacterium]
MPSDAELDLIRRLALEDHGLAVVVTQRSDGSPLCSLVNAGILEHPITHAPAVGFVSRGDAVRLKHLRRSPRATVVFRSGWQWVAAEGRTTLAGPSDAVEGLTTSIPTLLREIFVAAGGSHDNWAEYDRVMREEGRTAVLVDLDRVYSNR